MFFRIVQTFGKLRDILNFSIKKIWSVDRVCLIANILFHVIFVFITIFHTISVCISFKYLSIFLMVLPYLSVYLEQDTLIAEKKKLEPVYCGGALLVRF